MDEAPFRPANLLLGWRLGASLEIDVIPAGCGRLLVAHDPTLGPSTTGRGWVSGLPLAAMAGLRHLDGARAGDPGAPLLPLADLVAGLRGVAPAPGASLQLDLILPGGRPLAESTIADAAAALRGLEAEIFVGSYHLDQARRLAEALPGARVGYDPTRGARRQGFATDPARLFRHLERRRRGLAIAYLRHDLVSAAAARGFPLAARLLDLGIETDAWTVNPGAGVSDAALRALAASGVRQITTDAPIALARRLAAL
jgi:glycerophosphoryl diester phosphodiesterase